MNDENTKELIPSSINTSVDKVCEVAMKICEMGSSCSYRLSSTLIFLTFMNRLTFENLRITANLEAYKRLPEINRCLLSTFQKSGCNFLRVRYTKTSLDQSIV